MKAIGTAAAGILVPQDYQMPGDMKGKRKKVRPEDLRSGTLYGQYQLRGSILTIKDASTTASGYMAFGTDMTTIPTSASAGTGIYIDYTGVYGLSSGTKQFYLQASDGKAYAGAGAVTLDADGLTIASAFNNESSVLWKDGSDIVSGISAYSVGAVDTQHLTLFSNYDFLTGGAAFDASGGTLGLITKGSLGTTSISLIANSSANYVVVDADGGVIIGASSAPNAMLDVRGSAIFNESGANVDFRIEGDTNANLFFVDASTDRIGIGTSSPGGLVSIYYTNAATTAGYNLLDVHAYFDQTATSNFNNFAFTMQMETATAGGVTNNWSQAAILAAGNIKSTHAGTLGSVFGIRNVGYVFSGAAGTVNNYYAHYSGMTYTGTITTTIGNWYGIYADNAAITAGGGTITNLYGVYVASQTGGGTLNYAIYTNTGLVRFGDAVTGTNAIKSSHATAGIGYATGAGGTVTQATSKATGVTLNKACGTITMHNAALAAATTVTFTLTNSAIAATDLIVLNHTSAGTAGAYTLNAQVAAGSATINVRNVTAGSLSEAIVIRFAVIKGATS